MRAQATGVPIRGPLIAYRGNRSSGDNAIGACIHLRVAPTCRDARATAARATRPCRRHDRVVRAGATVDVEPAMGAVAIDGAGLDFRAVDGICRFGSDAVRRPRHRPAGNVLSAKSGAAAT